MNKKIIFSILLGTALLPKLASAAVTIRGMVDGAVQTTFYVASGIVVILWVMTGVIFLTAQGAPEKLSTGKKALIASVAGTVLVIIAGGAINLVKGMFNI